MAVEREVEGDLLVQDMGEGIPFRPGTFDGVISVSALQWLCNADKSSHNPRKRMLTFFTTLYGAMTQGGRAVFQFYPETPDQARLRPMLSVLPYININHPWVSPSLLYSSQIFLIPNNAHNLISTPNTDAIDHRHGHESWFLRWYCYRLSQQSKG